jgi:hypothetical protein
MSMGSDIGAICIPPGGIGEPPPNPSEAGLISIGYPIAGSFPNMSSLFL